MSTFLRIVLALAAVALLVAIGTGVYNAGVSAGLADAAAQAGASVQPVPAYGYGPYWHGFVGFPIFGIFFWILGIFLIFALVRGALGWGRWRGPRRWDGASGPGRDRLEQIHRELHRNDADSPQGPA